MRRLILILALMAATSAGQTLVAHTNAAVNSGAVTTSAIDTTGANWIGFWTWTTFSPGTRSDNQGNTWTVIGNGDMLVHNSHANLFVCTIPCKTGASHTFTLANNGTGFNQGIVITAFSGTVFTPVAGTPDPRDLEQNSGTRQMQQHGNFDIPPSTIKLTTPWKPTGSTVFMMAGCAGEQGTGAAGTIDNSMTQADHTAAFTVFYKIVSNPGVNFDPTCTLPGDATHIGIMVQGFSGANSGVPGFPKHKAVWR